MRKTLKRYLPDHGAVHSSRWLRPFANTLLHPRLWHLNRHSAAGAVAVGLFCGLIPGPLQMPTAAVACVAFKVNLPLALLTTLYTNPLTIVPLYVAAYTLGTWAMGVSDRPFVLPPELGGMNPIDWAGAVIDWMAGLGKPLALGLILLAGILSLFGYVTVKAAWRAWLVRNWQRRRMKRRAFP
jgi:uncharacterized protein (DUF2062 family)